MEYESLIISHNTSIILYTTYNYHPFGINLSLTWPSLFFFANI